MSEWDKLADYDLGRIANALEDIGRSLRKLVPKEAKSLTVSFLDLKGQKLMPATLTIGQTATAVAQEWSAPNGTGVKLPPAGAISFASSDPTIATVDAASGLVTAVAAGAATITATDAANGLTGSDSVSDTPLTAQSLTVSVTAN